MSFIYYALPGAEALAKDLAHRAQAKVGSLEVHQFPDGEIYVRAHTPCRGQRVVLVADLARPDRSALPLLFAADLMHDLGAEDVGLVAPYLAYMRQDKRFHEGEAITSASFAKLVNNALDWMITVDPHLHRRKSLSEIYSIPASALHAAPVIGDWIAHNVPDALLVGPDGESEQWVKAVAEVADMPFIVLTKVRHGDRDVEVSVPHADRWHDRTPVLVDDIISTARKMIETISHLKNAEMKPPVCIGVHAIFAGDGYEALKNSGASRIITCNAVPHSTNAIDLTGLIASGIQALLSTKQGVS